MRTPFVLLSSVVALALRATAAAAQEGAAAAPSQQESRHEPLA